MNIGIDKRPRGRFRRFRICQWEANVGWNAETGQRQFDINTVLAVYKTPWGPQVPVIPLPSGANVVVRFTSGSVFTISVIETDGEEAIVETSDKTRWKMRQVALKELRFPPPGTADAPTTYWVVTERLKGNGEA